MGSGLNKDKDAALSLKDEREGILEKYAGIVKLGRNIKLKEIRELGEDR